MVDFSKIEKIIDTAFAEDIGEGDVTSALLIDDAQAAEYFIVAREELVVAGIDIANMAFEKICAGLEFEVFIENSNVANAGDKIARIKARARDILTAERTALNLLQRACAVATTTRKYVEAIGSHKAKLLDTRKTMPGLRALDKYAVTLGGGHNHRMRLDDAILIKDNHVAACGGIEAAVKRAQEGNAKNLPIIVECDDLQQFEAAMSLNPDYG